MGVEGRLLNVLGWTGVWLPAAKFKECNKGSESAQPSIGASTRPQPSGSSNIGWAHDAVAFNFLHFLNSRGFALLPPARLASSHASRNPVFKTWEARLDEVLGALKARLYVLYWGRMLWEA